MGATERRPDAMAGGRFNPLLGFRGVAVVTAVLVLVQALLAGQGLFVDTGRIEVHGWVGNATFLAAIALLAAAFAAWRRGTLGRSAVVLSAVLLLLTVAQLGLGYSGRESSAAASWHVPNGVLIFGVSAALLVLAFEGGTRVSDGAETRETRGEARESLL